MTVMYDTVLEAGFDLYNDMSFDGSIEDTEPFSASLEIPESVGSVAWNAVTDKPFETIGDTLKVRDGVLDINIYETTNDEGGTTVIIGN